MTTRIFLRGQLGALRARGYDVTAISAPGEELEGVAEREGVRIVTVPMQREISPARDLISMVRMFRALRKLRPDILQTGTPKASLLAMWAGKLLRVPVRVYLVRGLRLETARGWKRGLLLQIERLTAACAHRVLCESPSLRKRYLELGLCSEAKATVIGPGMLNGVDSARFAPDSDSAREAQRLRSELDIPQNAPVIGFVGRFVRDKGIVELSEAYQTVLQHFPEARLLLVGDFERGDPLPEKTAEWIGSHPQVVRIGYVHDVARYYHLMDVLAFPSYREGFPASPMEAAAAGKPVVGFRATGTVDAVLDGVTGTLVPQGDSSALASALIRYLGDSSLRSRHGKAGQTRVASEFQPERMWDLLCCEYDTLLQRKGYAQPCGDVRQQAGPPIDRLVS